MPIDMESLEIGAEYVRDTLAPLLGYKSRQAISRGIVTPVDENIIILFVTKIKQKSDTQYHDYFIEEGLLHMEGETSHTNDKRIINAEANKDLIYLFYRDIHHTPFKYYGRAFLVDYKQYSDKPSIFILSTSVNQALSASALSTEQNKTNSVEINFIADEEGATKTRIHVSYERSIKNRTKAIEIHGTTCKACGFKFNEFYGEDLANNFIEIHHTVPLSELKEGTSINSLTDLVPLCSNCHSMIHRRRNRVMTVVELQSIIKAQKYSSK
ncbi:HNH endonuclease [Paenibacillus medicaginis]|uniref:HNH endonuclease n=1 Tax=Paenibacillus medicaginis TaxID=1470560 RepID=A0ABV5C5Z3_9BACL